MCLCNGLLATAGVPQYRAKSDYEDPAVVTAGSDFGGVRDLMDEVPATESFYSAADVITYLSREL